MGMRLAVMFPRAVGVFMLMDVFVLVLVTMLVRMRMVVLISEHLGFFCR